jgi:hypothetical protein
VKISMYVIQKVIVRLCVMQGLMRGRPAEQYALLMMRLIII